MTLAKPPYFNCVMLDRVYSRHYVAMFISYDMRTVCAFCALFGCQGKVLKLYFLCAEPNGNELKSISAHLHSIRHLRNSTTERLIRLINQEPSVFRQPVVLLIIHMMKFRKNLMVIILKCHVPNHWYTHRILFRTLPGKIHS